MPKVARPAVESGFAVRPRRAFVVFLAAACALSLLSAAASAAPPSDRPQPKAAQEDHDGGSSPDRTDTTGQQVSDAELEELRRAARRDGSVRAILGLQLVFEPEGRAGRGHARAQRRTIAREQAAVRRDLRGSGYEELRAYKTVPYMAVRLPERAIDAVERSDRIASAEVDEPVPPALAESSPLVQADQLWGLGNQGAERMVAVLDTGVDRTHPFFDSSHSRSFESRVTEEACYSSNASGSGWTATTVCPDGTTSQTGTGAGVNCDTNIFGCNHGTHVAGIAAGSGDTRHGVARGASIMAVQVFTRFDGSICTNSGVPSPCALSYTSDQIAGLERVHTRQPVRPLAAANMSLGGGKHTSACDGDSRKLAIDNLASADIATTISSGNSGWTDAVGAPACISTAVTVGSTTKSDQVSSFSNGHPTMVDLLAPGSSITSSVPGGGFATFNGTSMAAPHVAGAWALLREHDPSASVATHLASLETTGLPVTDSRGSTSFTTPRINVYDAAFADGSPPDLLVEAVGDLPGWRTQGDSLTVTDTTTNNGGSPAAESQTRYYLSADQVRDGTDQLLSGTRVVAALMGGTSSTGSQTATIPSTTPSGTYYVLACADDTGVVSEADEANNCRASRDQIRVSTPLPDLEVSVSNPPASASPGETFSVTDTTTNTGAAPASASQTRYYLSGGSRDLAEPPLVGDRGVPALAAGASSTGSATATIPSDLPPGQYRLLACADDTSLVDETDESNNCRTSGTRVDVS